MVRTLTSLKETKSLIPKQRKETRRGRFDQASQIQNKAFTPVLALLLQGVGSFKIQKRSNYMNALRSVVQRTWRFALVLILLAGLILPDYKDVRADLLPVYNPFLPEEFSWPSWWDQTQVNGEYTDDCYKSVYDPAADPDSFVMNSWRGIQACGPQPWSVPFSGVQYTPPPLDPNDPAPVPQLMFQCAELAKRYLRIAYGAEFITASGDEIASNYASSYPTKFQLFTNNGQQPVYPKEGDVVSFTTSDPEGHVAIVTALYVSDTVPGYGSITLMDQNNGSDGEFTAYITNYLIGNYTNGSGTTFHPINWIHPIAGLATENSPIVTSTTNIAGIAHNQYVTWIAGDDFPSGSIGRKTVTWNWNGSVWTMYRPPIVGSTHHYLHDITIGENGDVYTVGEFITYYSGSYRRNTLVFKWSGTAWVRKTSDNDAGGQSYLNAVGMAGNDVYAVGYYSSSGYKPLLLKWDGVKFANQNLALPPGVTSGSLTDISFNSATNGWIAGSLGGYTYHFDGASWTPVQLPSGTAVTRVVATSVNDAWGISYNSNRLFHYTTAGGWQEYMYSFPTGTKLYGIDANSPDNVWTVGYGGNGNYYYWFYDGASWDQIPANPSAYTDISVAFGQVWAVGNKSCGYNFICPQVFVR